MLEMTAPCGRAFNAMIKKCAVWLVLLLGEWTAPASASQQIAIPRSVSVPLRFNYGYFGGPNSVNVPCAFNGGARRSCFLDTGSMISAVPEDEESLGYTQVGQSRMQAASGTPLLFDLVATEKVMIGDAAIPLASIGRSASITHQGGMIGNDALADQVVLFDFEKKVLVFSPGGAIGQKLGNAGMGRSSLGDALPIIHLSIALNTLVTLWDTGVVNPLTLRQEWIDRHPRLFRYKGDSTAGMDAADHRIKAKGYELLAPLDIGPLSVAPGLLVNGVDFLPEYDFDAILGFDLLRQCNWFFDFPNRSWAAFLPSPDESSAGRARH